MSENIKKNVLFAFWCHFCLSWQIWDLASGKLKLSLTGHISTVRGVAVSSRSPYLFSCGEDKQVKCWDLEYNKVRVDVSVLRRLIDWLTFIAVDLIS